jgi:Sulfotransferase family
LPPLSMKLSGADRMNPTSFPDCSPIFVVGAGRSGTTLLQLMLNAHPEIAIAGEVTFFDQILPLRSKFPDLDTPERIDRLFALLPRLKLYKYLTEVDTIFPEVQQRVKADPAPSYEKLYRFILEAYGAARGARRFGEKTPSNIRHLDALASIFPNCKIIHVIRDPRATVASRTKVPIFSNDVLTHSIKWKLDICCGRAFAQESHIYREIHYEKLVVEPVATLRHVCRFLGEEYDDRMLEYHWSSAKHIKGEPWKYGTQDPVYRSSLETWRRELSEGQIHLIELITGPQMAHHGYPRSNVRLRAKLLTPLHMVRELFRWGRHKRAERKVRQGTPTTINGTNARLYHLLWRVLVQR